MSVLVSLMQDLDRLGSALTALEERAKAVEAQRDALLAAATKFLAFIDRIGIADSAGSEDTGAYLSVEGQHEVDDFRAAVTKAGAT